MSEIKYIKKRTTRNAIEALRPDTRDYYTYEEYSAAWEVWDSCWKVIDGATPADVAPVVRGRWIEIEAPFGGKAYGCSQCGKAVLMDYDYCPYCGAKMDESEDKQ